MLTVVVRITEPAKKGGAFPVELLASDAEGTLKAVPGGRASIPSNLTPDAEVKGPNGLALSVDTVRELYDEPQDVSDAFAAIGEFLFRLVARGKLAEAWAKLRDDHGGGTRTILDIAPAPALRALHELPWELMYDPLAESHVFLDVDHPCVRGEPRALEEANPIVRAGARKYPFASDEWPLRVLVIFGADSDMAEGKHTQGIGASSELRHLETLFAASRFDVDFEVLEQPTRDEIVHACRTIQPHVFHFIGHGEGDADPKKHSLLIYRGGAPQPTYEQWPLFDIRNDLQGIPLRFVFLNACRTSNGGGGVRPPGPGAPFASIADAFFNLGALGVIGMQGDVPGDVAGDYSRAFYEAVIAGNEIDVAATKARRVVSQAPGRANYIMRREWSFPVLRTRVMPSLVLPRRPTIAGAGTLVERFVSLVAQRRIVCDTVRTRLVSKSGPPPAASPSSHLVAIVGDRDVGKSYLARWCAQAYARGGPRAVYVAFGENESVDVVDALRWIRDGQRPIRGLEPARRADWPLPAEPFRRFNWELNHRLKGLTIVPPLPDDMRAVQDKGDGLPAERPAEGFFQSVFSQFRAALEAAAKPNGLLLVLDQVEQIQSASLAWVTEHLLQDIAGGGVKDVRAIVVARTDDFRDRLKVLQSSPVAPTVVEVGYYKVPEFDRVARQLCFQWSPDRYEEVKDALPKILAKNAEDKRWRGGVLKKVNMICEALGRL
jgi:hypothetical protein